MTRLEALAEAADLAVLAVPSGSRVLVVGVPGDRLAEALAGRGCTVADAASDEPVDAVVVGDLSGSPSRPGALLAEAACRLSSWGRLVAVAPNVTHGAVRLALMKGRFPTAGKGSVFDRTVLERLFREAGLAVVDRLEVRRGFDETDVDVDLDAFKPEVVASVEDDPDSKVAAFVFVGRRAGTDASDVPTGGSLVAELQDRIRRAEAEATRARGDADARDERCRELEEAVRQRVAELDDLQGELHHARMDLQLKDAYSLEMRSAAQGLRQTVAQLEEQLRQAEDQLHQAEEQLRQAHALLATRSGELAAARTELDLVTTEMAAVTTRASYLLVEGASRALERYKPVLRLVQGVARRLARPVGRRRLASGD